MPLDAGGLLVSERIMLEFEISAVKQGIQEEGDQPAQESHDEGDQAQGEHHEGEHHQEHQG
jgi:hypothetical protein